MKRIYLFTSVLLAGAGLASVAQAQEGEADVGLLNPGVAPSEMRTMDNALSVFGILGYGYAGLGSAPGVGARFQKSLVTDVFLKGPKVHDDIAIEGGIDFVHYSWGIPGFPNYNYTYNEISVVLSGVWNVWINEKLSVYPKLELAYAFGSVSASDELTTGIVKPSLDGLWFQGAGGALYKFNETFAVRGELGWRALRVGVGITL